NECEKAAPDSGARDHRAAIGPDCHGYVPPESRGVALGSMGVLGEGGGVAAGAGTAGAGSGWRGPPHALPSAISAIPRMRASSVSFRTPKLPPTPPFCFSTGLVAVGVII